MMGPDRLKITQMGADMKEPLSIGNAITSDLDAVISLDQLGC